jgi:outer membrane receptor protein involved in Fe transport
MSDDLATSRRSCVALAVAGAVALSGLAAAQTPEPKSVATEAATEEKILTEVVVTGSRVRRDEFTSASPVQVITRDQSVLAGLSTTTEILQGSTATGGGQQINSYFGGFITEGGPGANTVSLRGLGAIRTLVLLNGRRLAPAGTRGQVGSADLNVLPTALVERIEILKDGASSIYGSDAVAGVVNIITRRGIDEFTVEGSFANTFDGGGDQTVASLVGGRTGDRFEINGSFEFYERTEITVGDREWARCSTDYLRDPATGARVDPIVDKLTGLPRCNPVGGDLGVNALAHNYMLAPIMGGNRWEADGAATGVAPGWKNVDANADRAPFPSTLYDESLVSPAKTYTGFVAGSYDLRALGDAEIYFELLGTRRESQQHGARQLSLDYNVGNPLVPLPFRTAAAPFVRSPRGDLMNARAFVSWGTDTSSQEVDFWRAVGGLRGNLGFLDDWKYDVNVVYNDSDASYTFESFLIDRVYDSVDVVVAPAGTTAPTRVVDGVRYTCRVNTTNAAAGCVPAPQLGAQFLRGEVDDAYRRYMFVPVTGNTEYQETTLSAIFDGGLFALPAGEVKAALGFEFRKMELDDTPSIESINRNLYNLTSGGATKGEDEVQEVFAEVEVPILRGAAFAEDLTVNLSGRYTEYDTYGSDETYKIGLGWTPVKWLKLRGTTGTSFRAPALYEQFLSPTTGFLASSADPCNNFGQLAPTSTRRINCQSEFPGQANFIATNGVTVNTIGGAQAGLESEQSTAKTFGIVVQPESSTAFGDLSFAIDWWEIDIEDQVTRLGGANILNLCYNDPQFRSGGAYCTFVAPRVPGQGLTVADSYINIASQVAQGLDYNVRYAREIGVGEFRADLRATQYRKQDDQLLPTDPVDRNNGTLFQPEWVGDIDLRYVWKDWTFRYGLTYVGKMDSYEEFDEDKSTSVYDLDTAEYITHSASVQYESPDKWEVTLGIRNFTDEEPEPISGGVTNLRQGDRLLYSGYDFLGRTVFFNLAKTF